MGRMMKYMLLTFMLLTVSGIGSGIMAQHYVGVKGGWGGAMGRFYPKRETAMFWGRYTGGVTWKYYSPQQIFGGVGAELEYQQRGYMYYFGNKTDSTTYYKRTVNSITVPLLWQPHFYLFSRHARVFVEAGITFSYNLGDSYVETGTKRGGVVDRYHYGFMVARDCRMAYGLCAGGGLSVFAGRVEFCASARYYYGFSDILRNRTKYYGNPLRSELDNLFITFGMWVRLGKGGILAPPLRKNPNRKALREAEKNEFMNIKID